MNYHWGISDIRCSRKGPRGAYAQPILQSFSAPLHNTTAQIDKRPDPVILYTIAIIMHALHGGLCDAPGPQLLGAVAPADAPCPPALPRGGLSYTVVITGQRPAAVAAELSEEAAEECPASGARGRDVDYRVPEAH